MHPLHASAPIANEEHLSHMRRHREGTGCPDWNGSSRIELDLEPGWRERLWAALARFRYSGRRPLLNLEAFKIVSRSATLFSAEAHARRCRLQTIQASRAPAQPGHRTATCLLHTRPQWCAHLRRTLQRHREHPSSRPSLDQHCLSTPNSGTFSARRGRFVSQIGSRLRIGPEMVIGLPSRRDSWLTTPNSPGLFDLHQLSVEMEEGRTHDRERTPSVTGRDSHDTTTHWLLTTTRPHAVRQDTRQDPAREPARRSL